VTITRAPAARVDAMGDISAEPSMEDILSSIKRIIAEEGEPARPRRGGAAPRAIGAATPAPPPPAALPADDEVLELSDPIEPEATPAPAPQPASRSAGMFERAASVAAATSEAAASPASQPVSPTPANVSPATVEATRGALDSLSRLVVRPDVAGSDTLEGLVRDMLRPMLAQWLDQHLPALVEQMVAREIARITAAEL
jgi:uncharacterized protein